MPLKTSFRLVVKKCVFPDAFLDIAGGTGEEDIVGILPLVLERILHTTFLAIS